jgi:hypothetical protein
MSTVNKYNYEAVLLDFAEGRLSASETDALFDFLAAHPELQEDFDAAMEMFSLKEDEAPVFSAKNALLQDETLDAKQSLIIAQLENVASEDETKTLHVLLENDKTTKQEYAVFSKMKLEADETIVFARKENLIQTVSISFATYVYRATYAAAAAALIFLAFNGINISNKNAEYGLAILELPKFEWPEKSAKAINDQKVFKPAHSAKQPKAHEDSEKPQRPIENLVAFETIEQIEIITATQLRDNKDNGAIAELKPVKYVSPEKRDQIPSLMDRIANESNVFNVTYGFAETVAKKLKTAREDYADTDYIEIKIWKVHTQIRKPSWMKANRP